MFLGFGRFLIEFDFPTNGFTPEFDILKPSHSICFWKNAHFSHFTAIFLLSKMFKMFVNIALCSFNEPFEAIKMSSIHQLVKRMSFNKESITLWNSFGISPNP